MSKRINKPDTQADIDLRECLRNKISFVIIAGAGSGKTTSLIKALKFIDDTEGKKLRQHGKRIACITYTTTAEKEIMDDVGQDSFFHVSTIHSFLWELIRPFQPNIKTWVINKIETKIDDLIQKKLAFGVRVHQSTRDKNEADITRYRETATRIGNVSTFKYETGSNYLEGILGHSDVIAMVPDLINSNPLLQNILAEKYPYFFIDESQDTLPHFVNTMKLVARNTNNFCLGFFGDPMQKIYLAGAGAIALEENWKQIDKPENFRCPVSVLALINNIRQGGDNLQQNGGRKEKIGDEWQYVQGSTHLFILQNNENREEKIEQVRRYLTDKNNDLLWSSDSKDADMKILVIEHRMAAKRLKFGELFSIFNDNSTESLSTGFKEGTLWALQPFVKFIVPLTLAHRDGRHFEIIELLRKFSPLLQKSYLQTLEQPPQELLGVLKNFVVELYNFICSDTTTVRQVLNYINTNNIMQLDERITSRLNRETPITLDDSEEVISITDNVIEQYFEIPVKQLLGYQIYINDESAYSTQHSVKGAEFERVLVVLDDEEGNSHNYSYEKLFGIVEPSATDQGHIAAGRDSTLDRTRRLLYVCCSRSLKDLAVVLFVSDIEAAVTTLQDSRIFAEEDIVIETEMLSYIGN